MLRGLDCVNGGELLPLVEEWRTQNHKYKLKRRRIKGDMMKNLMQHVVEIWNVFCVELMEADSIVAFKGELDNRKKNFARL